jgi:hypothetical protein
VIAEDTVCPPGQRTEKYATSITNILSKILENIHVFLFFYFVSTSTVFNVQTQ